MDIRRTRLLLIAALLLFTARALQADTWTTITSGWRALRIAVTADRAFAASEGGIIVVDRGTLAAALWNCDQGLFSNEVKVVAVQPGQGVLWIGYADGALDRFDLSSGRLRQRVLDFFNESSVFTIRDIRFSSDAAYIATDAGVSRMEPADVGDDIWVVKDTYRNFGSWSRPIDVLRVLPTEDTLWLLTRRGVARAPLEANLIDAASWTVYDYGDELPECPNCDAESATSLLTELDGQVYVGVYLVSVQRWTGSGFERVGSDISSFGLVLDGEGNLVLAGGTGLYRLSEDGSRWERLIEGFDQKVFDVVYDGGELWCALETERSYPGNPGGVLRDAGGERAILTPNTPGGNQIMAIKRSPSGEIWLTSRSERIRGAYHLHHGAWEAYSRLNVAAPVFDILQINMQAIGFDAFGGVWLGTRGSGALYIPPESSPDTLRYFDNTEATGSRLRGISSSDNFVLVMDFAASAEGGLWIANQQARDQKPLVYVPPGWFAADPAERDTIGWMRYGATDGLRTNFIGLLEVDDQDRVWMGTRTSDTDPLVLLDPAGTPGDPTDDVYHYFRAPDYVFDFTEINDMTLGHDGMLWLGTPSGLFMLDTHLPVSQMEAIRMQGALGEAVTAVAIDPVDQVWVGTNFGVSVLGNDRFTWVRHYTTDAGAFPSPLVDDNITALEFLPVTGEAYIGTNEGISVVTTPFRNFGSELGRVTVSPQPFFSGPNESVHLTFGGNSLVPGAEVKIFTPSGRLIRTLAFDQAALSGWDGRDYAGEWAPSGVYLLLITSPEGKSKTGKVALIRR